MIPTLTPKVVTDTFFRFLNGEDDGPWYIRCVEVTSPHGYLGALGLGVELKPRESDRAEKRGPRSEVSTGSVRRAHRSREREPANRVVPVDFRLFKPDGGKFCRISLSDVVVCSASKVVNSTQQKRVASSMSGPATNAAATATASGIFRAVGFKTNKEALNYFTR